MSGFLDSRRRLIRNAGRPMTLRRRAGTGFIDVTLSGVFALYRPEQFVAGVMMGDAHVATLQDEIAAAGWPGPPRAGDFVLIERTWQVVGVMGVHDGADVIGWYLWIRGG